MVMVVLMLVALHELTIIDSPCSCSNVSSLDGSVYDGLMLLLPTHVHAAQISIAQVTWHVLPVTRDCLHANVQLSDGLRVLDFGCGTGYISAAAALLVGQSGSVDAVDLNAGDVSCVMCDV
jgi:tRNA A58 N-methylase Trm61